MRASLQCVAALLWPSLGDLRCSVKLSYIFWQLGCPGWRDRCPAGMRQFSRRLALRFALFGRSWHPQERRLFPQQNGTGPKLCYLCAPDPTASNGPGFPFTFLPNSDWVVQQYTRFATERFSLVDFGCPWESYGERRQYINSAGLPSLSKNLRKLVVAGCKQTRLSI